MNTQPIPTGRHREQRDGEIFLGNYRYDDFVRSGWATKRIGLVAAQTNGLPVNMDLKPLFVSEAEAREAGLPIQDGQVCDVFDGLDQLCAPVVEAAH